MFYKQLEEVLHDFRTYKFILINSIWYLLYNSSAEGFSIIISRLRKTTKILWYVSQSVLIKICASEEILMVMVNFSG